MGGEKPLEYSEMEDLHFQKFVTEFPFLTGILALSFDSSQNTKATSVKVTRISTELLRWEVPHDGRAIRDRGANDNEVESMQLFAVKGGLVGELSGFYSHESDTHYPYEYFLLPDGSFDYNPEDELLTSSDWQDDFDEPAHEEWPTLRLLEGDEDYLVTVYYRTFEGRVETDDGLLRRSGQYYYQRVVVIHKPPPGVSMAKAIERWKELEYQADVRAFNDWCTEQEKESIKSLRS